MDEVTTCESSVADTTDIIKQLVDAHATQLLCVLESLKATELKNVESRKTEMKSQAAILKSFNRYTKEVIDKGSFKDMSHMITDLIKRTEELKQAFDSYLELHRVQHIQSGVVFTSSSLCDDFRDAAVDWNIIGMITMKGSRGFYLFIISPTGIDTRMVYWNDIVFSSFAVVRTLCRSSISSNKTEVYIETREMKTKIKH